MTEIEHEEDGEHGSEHEDMGGLERAPRATRDAWAQSVLAAYKNARTVNWQIVLDYVKMRVKAAADKGTNLCDVSDLPPGACAYTLRQKLRELHPSMGFQIAKNYEEGRTAWIPLRETDRATPGDTYTLTWNPNGFE